MKRLHFVGVMACLQCVVETMDLAFAPDGNRLWFIFTIAWGYWAVIFMLSLFAEDVKGRPAE